MRDFALKSATQARIFLVVYNRPFDPSDGRYVLSNTLNFFYDYLGVDLNEDRIKARRILPGTVGSGLFASVIVKLIYFKEKEWAYSCRRKLKQQKKQLKQQKHNLNKTI